ncbi:MAG: carbohydrate porin [Legionellaceae bacterium]|nr:carbohydrate porin [Legionellaceae bacterium]
MKQFDFNKRKSFIVSIFLLGFISNEAIAAKLTSTNPPLHKADAVDDSSHREGTGSHISSNPAAVETAPGSGAAQQYIEKLLGIKNDHGFKFSGVWLGDGDQLFSNGIPNSERLTGNSLLLLNATWDPKALLTQWKGGLFDVELLQLNAQDTNGQAGAVQGYNSLPGPPPLNRFEVYQLWYRQNLLEDKLVIRVGKMVPTIDFNNVVKPVPLDEQKLFIPAITGLIYTPIFINPSMLGTVPGYYNSAYGATLSLLPVKNTYLTYGIYDGNLAQGKQTGLEGPHFNGHYIQLGEAGVAWLLHNLPGTIAVGAWHQTGLISSPPSTLSENEASGLYSFGAQRLWYKDTSQNNNGISCFYQFGINNSNVMPMTQYVGFGLTAFGLVPHRDEDSFGVGTAISWLNQTIFTQRTESMYQIYYQAKVVKDIYLEPVLSYIPDPGAAPNLPPAWAGTMRAVVLF